VAAARIRSLELELASFLTAAALVIKKWMLTEDIIALMLTLTNVR
jgi:hypothetical protein